MENNARFSRRAVITTGSAVALSALAPAAWAQVQPPLSVYAHLPSVGPAAISPDGRRAAYVTSGGDGFAVNQLDLSTGARLSLPLADCSGIPVLMWADDDTVFAVASHTERLKGARYESWIGYLFDLGGGRRYRLYGDMPEYGSNLAGDFHRIRRGGTYYVTASNYRPTAANYRIDYATAVFGFSLNQHALPIDDDTRHILSWVIRPDGHPLARSEYDDVSRTWLLRYYGPHGWIVIYRLPCQVDLPQLKGIGRDGKSVLVYFRSGPFDDAFVELRADGTFSEVLASNRSQYTPLFSPVTGNLIGFSDEAGLAGYIFYDPAYQALPGLITKLVGGGHVAIADGSEDPTKLILYTEGNGNPGRYLFADLKAGTTRLIGETYPDLPRTALVAKTRVTYPAGDGLPIEALLTRPPGKTKPGALVVLVHGGPESYDDERFDWMAQALVSRGYTVLQPNFRGSAGYGSAFVAKGYGEWGRRMQTDLSDGVKYVVDKGLADPARVAIAGASYGGYAALAGVSLQSGVYRCAVSMSGMSDMKAFMADVLRGAGFDRENSEYVYWRRFLGDENSWDAISPLRHADAVKVPVLLIHGRDDAVVAFEQSQRMRDALASARTNVDLVLLKDEDHYLSREPTRLQTLGATLDFLIKNNPPG